MTAIAGRAGVDLPLSRFDELSRGTPMIVNLKPTGQYLMEDLFYAGGVGAVLQQMLDLLDLDCLTVSGNSLGEDIAKAERFNDDVIRDAANALSPEGGIASLTGSLAPDGAVIKHGAASPELLKHRGKAVVFDSYYDLRARIDDPNLDVEPEDILVMRNAGPVGGPGMPEWGFLPLPRKILERGIRDMVRISDARMSGTAFGTIVLHVSPESAVGGPLALVNTGDLIELDVPNRRLDLLVDDAELARRRADWDSTPREPITRTAGDTAACTRSTSCRPRTAATSTSSAAAPPSKRMSDLRRDYQVRFVVRGWWTVSVASRSKMTAFTPVNRICAVRA